MGRAEAEETFRAGRGPMTDAELANLIADCLVVGLRAYGGARGRVAPAEAR